MIDFHRVTIADKAWVDPIVAAEDSRSADFNFGNIYMWDGAYRQHLAALEGRLLTKEHPEIVLEIHTREDEEDE